MINMVVLCFMFVSFVAFFLSIHLEVVLGRAFGECLVQSIIFYGGPELASCIEEISFIQLMEVYSLE